jgi:transposase
LLPPATIFRKTENFKYYNTEGNTLISPKIRREKNKVGLKINSEDIQTLSLDHHGLVASVCKDLGIAEKIDALISNQDKRRVVSPGQAAVAMILNGMGFTNRRLYLTSQFFETKPVSLLLDDDELTANDLTDYTLGHTLDEIYDYGASELFAQVAFNVAIEQKLLCTNNHLDTTSFTVHGEYKELGEEGIEVIEITHGHSKDHRPDLKQAVLSLVVNGPSGAPIFMEPLNGNNSDKVSFQETIKKVNAFKKQINVERDFKWIADSALYTKSGLLKMNDFTWLTRVPHTIKEARDLSSKPDTNIPWKEQEDGYKTSPFTSNYGGNKQRWLLVFSQQAYNREKKTYETNLEKKDEALKKALWHLGNEVYKCEKDGLKALKKLEKKHPLYVVKAEIVEIKKHAKAGKPKAGEAKIVVGYQIVGSFERNSVEIENVLNSKGRFILATNDLDSVNYTDEQMLKEYKEQQKVEGGFRFLKDPWFMVDSIFLKSPKRIEALMMVMTLCLMVYNIAQYKLRELLKEKNETLPNQLGKQVQNPTLRWIFQIMEGVSIVRFLKNEVIANLSDLRKKIIELFGNTAMKMYGLMVT